MDKENTNPSAPSASRCHLAVGDRVVARETIVRRGGGSVMRQGDTGVITSVWESDKSQIVSVQPDDPAQMPIADIVCMCGAPTVFEVVR